MFGQWPTQQCAPAGWIIYHTQSSASWELFIPGDARAVCYFSQASSTAAVSLFWVPLHVL